MLTADNISVECIQKHPGKRVPIDLADFVGLMLDAVNGGGGVEHTLLSIVDSRMTEQLQTVASALDQAAQRIEEIEAKSGLLDTAQQQVVTIIDDRLRTADEQLAQSIASLVQTAQSLVQRIERIEGVIDELASLVKAVRS
jgi:ABC-type transporter Mla subunit MlaD